MQLARFSVVEDRVTTPGGTTGVYQWVDAPDMVRVAALTEDGRIYVVQQHHYLPNTRMWQLPGGAVDPGEQPQQAAARELAEEVGAEADLTAEPVPLGEAVAAAHDGRIACAASAQLVLAVANGADQVGRQQVGGGAVRGLGAGGYAVSSRAHSAPWPAPPAMCRARSRWSATAACRSNSRRWRG